MRCNALCSLSAEFCWSPIFTDPAESYSTVLDEEMRSVLTLLTASASAFSTFPTEHGGPQSPSTTCSAAADRFLRPEAATARSPPTQHQPAWRAASSTSMTPRARGSGPRSLTSVMRRSLLAAPRVTQAAHGPALAQPKVRGRVVHGRQVRAHPLGDDQEGSHVPRRALPRSRGGRRCDPYR